MKIAPIPCFEDNYAYLDHAGGNKMMKELVPGVRVYGGLADSVEGCADKLNNGDRFAIGEGIEVLALLTPRHTKGHISYYVTAKGEETPAVFTGDTLFIAACGKFFEGMAEQMYKSLCVTLGSLPKPTLVYCGHEGKVGCRSPIVAIGEIRRFNYIWRG